MTRRDPQLPFAGGDDDGRATAPADAPCVYVATKITGTEPGSPEHQVIELAVEAITTALIEAAGGASNTWQVRVHAPVEWTTPDKTPDRTPKDIFTLNAYHVFAEADALVVYGWAPSAGVGQEFTWAATQLGLPVLYLEPPGHPASRQIKGTPGDVSVAGTRPPDELKERVRCWLRTHRHQIEANPGRRTGRRGRFALLHQQLSDAWARGGPGGRNRVAGHMGISPDLIEWWLSEVDFLAMAPAAHVLSLSTELTGSTDPVVGRHELTLGELEALLTARHEHGWDEAETESLRRRGERELAKPVVRRFKLDTPDDWFRLYEAIQP